MFASTNLSSMLEELVTRLLWRPNLLQKAESVNRYHFILHSSFAKTHGLYLALEMPMQRTCSSNFNRSLELVLKWPVRYSLYQPEELRSAIAAQDNAALERVPGIGKKVASRINLELKDKFSGGYRSKSSLSGPWRAQVIGALTGLGYSAKEAESALDDVLSDFGRTPSEADLPEMLKLALAQSRRKS